MYAHSAATSSPISQPPHSAGTPYKGLRAAIDPHQIPSPVEVIEGDRDKWDADPYMTLPGTHPPLSTTDYVAIDQGNSSPKFTRVSTWNFPTTSRLARNCEIPLTAIIQPFADLDPREEPVPLAELPSSQPPRCGSCRAYINPWCTWVAGGARWKCNLCSHDTEVDAEYFSNLDANLLRLDHAERPELNKGTVDFAVSEEYWAPHPPPRINPLYQPIFDTPITELRTPAPLQYLFIIDISMEAVRSGITRAASTFISRIFYGDTDSEQPACLPSGCPVGIMTYDSTLHFYDLSENLELPRMLVVADIDDVFLPSMSGLFVDAIESRQTIDKLLGALSQRDEHSCIAEAALGSALVGALALLTGRGGQCIVFASAMPTIGLGALTRREDETSLYETDKEISLYAPRSDAWQDIGEQCAEEGIGVSIAFCPNKPIDIATIGVVPGLTGGDLFFHPRFDGLRDALVLESQLRRMISRTTAYNAFMRIRCSNGVRVSNPLGNFYENSAGDLVFGTFDADQAISVTLEHTHSLDERQNVFMQSAVLYTTKEGQRRVRVCNTALPATSLAGNVFRFADMDSVVSHMIREAVLRLPTQKIAYIKEELTEKCSAILLAYRKNCAAATAPSQLIIPEAFRALPVYTLAMMKCKPLKGRNVTSDVRNYSCRKILRMGARSIMFHLYPSLLALHDLHPTIAVPDPASGIIDFPSIMRDSYLFMSSDGVYVIDNEEVMIFWIGNNTATTVLKDLFGVEEVKDINRDMLELPRIQSLLSTQTRNILAHRQLQRGGRITKILIARQNMDGAEIEFSDLLVEDQNNAAMSYLDYLCLVHKQINTALTSGGSLSGGSNFRPSPW